MERYNGWEDPAWRDYWGMNDDDNYDENYADEAAVDEDEIEFYKQKGKEQ